MKKIIYFLTLAILIWGIYFYMPRSSTSPFVTYANIIPNTYRIGFTNLDQEITNQELTIVGKVPKWLAGKLYRNGPAKFSAKNGWVDNWFDGLAMVHAFEIKDGKIFYTNKFLKTKEYKEVKNTGKMTYGGFLQDPCPSIFRYFSTIFDAKDKITGSNTNVNIAKIDDKLVALTETPLPIEFDKSTLETIGEFVYKDNLPKSNIHDTPHPHYDYQRKEYLGYFTKFGIKSSHNLFRIKDGSSKREIIGTYETAHPSYMHSFGITKNYAILTALPLVASPLDLIIRQQAFIKNFKWKPELGTKLIVFDRVQNKLIGDFITEPLFAFHVVNAFEENNKIYLDLVYHENSDNIYLAMLETVLNPGTSGLSDAGILKRYTIDLKSKKVSQETLLPNIYIELPRINYNFNGRYYNYVYAYSKDKETPGYYVADKLVKINIKTKEINFWQEKNCYPGEPVFIEAPNSKSEDDGIIISVILDSITSKSFLLILDGKSFIEICRAEIPHLIPFGIHGQFFGRS